jgi:hypothetical protein
MASKQSQAVQEANGLINSAAQVMGLFTQLVQLQGVWQDTNTGATLESFATCSLNPDGSLGAPDAQPDVTHPIDTTKHPELTRSLSATQIEQIKSTLDDIVSYINGVDVAANPGARAILNMAVGG